MAQPLGPPCEAMALVPHDQSKGSPEQGVLQHGHMPTTLLVGLLLPSSVLGTWPGAPRKPER